MIYESLNCLSEEMNDFFRLKLKVSSDKVVLSGITNLNGAVAIKEEDKVVITLINITKESIAVKNGNTSYPTKTYAVNSTPLTVNLSILISAYFNNYSESLKFLSYIIVFLQDKSVFNKANTPRLPDAVSKLTFELENLETERLSNLWATLGGKYMPSVVYKMRMLTIDSSMVKEYRPSVAGIADSD